MAQFRIIIFDVEHGSCAFLKTPTGCTLLIDCGRSDSFSPVDYILAHEMADTVSWNGHRLTKLIVTHPHDDHIEDIHNLSTRLEPAILQRYQYPWEEIKAQGGGEDYSNLDLFAAWQQKYNQTVLVKPDWGLDIRTFSLGPIAARALNENSFVNNSSIVVVVTFQGNQFSEKFLFGADMERDGWKQLLRNPEFESAIKNVQFYITSHHGHSSGFSTELFSAVQSRPIVNIVSVSSKDENVDSQYSKEEFAFGTMVGGEKRFMLSTTSCFKTGYKVLS